MNTQTTRKWGLTWCLYSTHIHDKPLLPSLPICMKPSNLSLECPGEVANVSSSYEVFDWAPQSAQCGLRGLTFTDMLQDTWHLKRIHFLERGKKAAPVHFVYEMRTTGRLRIRQMNFEYTLFPDMMCKFYSSTLGAVIGDLYIWKQWKCFC